MTTSEQPPPEGSEQPPQDASGEGLDDGTEAADGQEQGKAEGE